MRELCRPVKWFNERRRWHRLQVRNSSSINSSNTINNNNRPIAGTIGAIRPPFITIWAHLCAPWKVQSLKIPPFLLLGHSNLNQRLEWDLLLACLLTAGTGQTESNQFYRSDALMMTESCGAQNKTSVSPDPDGLSPINGQQHNTKEERSSRQRGGSSPSSKLRPTSIITWLPSSSHNVIL